MTLAYVTSVNAGSLTFRDACCNIANNTFAAVESTGPRLRVYNLTTLTMLTSATLSFSTPTGITMVSANSAVVVYSGSTTVDFLDTTTGALRNVTGGAQSGTYRTYGGQYVAGDLTTGIAYAVSGTAGQIVQINGANFTANAITLAQNDESPNYSCVVLKAPGRWLVGTNSGKILEIDTGTVIQDDFVLTYRDFPQGRKFIGAGGAGISIHQMAYDNNLLTCQTDKGLVTIDWSTKTILKNYPTATDSNTSPSVLSYPSSGVCIYSNAAPSSGPCVSELDITVQPLTVNDNLYTNITSQNLAGAGINSVNNNGYLIYNSGELVTFTVTPRSTSLHTVIMLSSSNAYLSGRVLILNDTNGVGTSKVILDTYTNSPATYRIPSGSTIIEAVKCGHGTTALWDLTRFST